MLLWQLIVAGVGVHIILFYSIFDIYFTSPLVHGMTPQVSELPPPAKRLVLFVADGLRADKFYELDSNGKPIAPYLRNIIETRGSWGVSHTRVPTETRPGHVALIAGFYEDVSAVAKGWKENPVDFDSVFNESRFTWAWGSPDVLPMFSKGASGDHVHVNCYSSELEDFGATDTNMIRLDKWVFDKVKDFFEESKNDKILFEKLHNEKIIFFLHLLGLDTAGHSQKPYSKSYMKNIEYVDDGLREIEEIMEEFYNHDGKTSYIMTADHGMTDWGSHGAGHPSETLTPLVAWGSGIQQPVHQQNCGAFPDNFCHDWKLNHLRRNDVEQADISPLMSYLIGAAFPLNSVGILPVGYLNISDWQKVEALYSNALQLIAQFEVKMNQVRESSNAMTFKYFQDLTPTKKIEALRNVKVLIKNGQFEQAIVEVQQLMKTVLLGLNYYQTYNRLFLGISIVCGFLGWMAFILQLVLREHSYIRVKHKHESEMLQTAVFYILGILVIILLFIQRSPWTYYLYCLLPVLLWRKASQGWNIVVHHINIINQKKEMSIIILSIGLTMIGLQILVLGFFYREILSVGLVGMAAWPYFISSKHISRGPITSSKHISRSTVIGWIVSCLLVAVFPLLPLVGQNSNYVIVMFSGVVEFIVGLALVYWQYYQDKRRNVSCILVLECVLIVLSTVVVYKTNRSIYHGDGLPVFCQIYSWGLLVICPCLPLLSKTSLEERLFSLGLSFTAFYQLLCITFEGFFLLSLSMLLYFWLKMEHETSNNNCKKILNHIEFISNKFTSSDVSQMSRWLEISDLRRTFFFIFLTLVGFFGTGNIASINSFDPASVYCFLTVFNPGVMGALMMIKNLIPLLIVTSVFRGVDVISSVPTRALFLLVLLMSDFMGLHFFFLVKDTGSWLDIGTSISHYIIVMSIIIFLMLLFGLSQILTTYRLKISSFKK